MHKNLVKFGHVVFELCDRQTDKQTVITILRTPPGGGRSIADAKIKLKVVIQLQKNYDIYFFVTVRTRLHLSYTAGKATQRPTPFSPRICRLLLLPSEHLHAL